MVLYGGQFGELLRVGAQDVEFAHAAFDVDHIVLGGEEDDVVGQFSHDFAEESGAEDNGTGGLDVSGDSGADSGFQIIAGEPQLFSCFQQNSF